jgi:uncharacterized membrane protein
MADQNPFDAPAGGAITAGPLSNTGGTLEPVPMEVGAILSRALEIVQAHPGTVIGSLGIAIVPGIVIGVIGGVLQVVADGSQDENTILAIAVVRLVLNIVSGLLGLFLQLGMVRIFTRLARGLEADVNMMFGEVRYLLPAIGAGILVGLATFFAFLLLIIPSVIVWLGTQFYLYCMVDRDLGAIDAISESWRITDGYKFTILVVNLIILVGAIVLTCLTLGIGYLAALPILALVQAVMYHSLLHLKGGDGALA